MIRQGVPDFACLTSRFFQVMDRLPSFEKHPKVVVATSGGADSLALCLLLKKWTTENKGKVISLTINHLLRKDSTTEALKVNQWLTTREIEHHILDWKEKKPRADIQNKARTARYHLLKEWCEYHHILHLFLAHHADDQEETILQRLLHGSGPLGLQGMKECTYHSFGRLLRPLLSISKKNLISYLEREGQEYFSDPSNQNIQFERVKARSLLPQIHTFTTTPYPFSQSAKKCGDFFEMALSQVVDFFLEAVDLSEFGFLKISKKLFHELEYSLQSLVLSQSLQAIGSTPYPFSTKQLEGTLSKIYSHQNTTIGGCFIVIKSLDILIVREARSLPPPTTIQKENLWWDNRFRIKIPSCFIGSQVIPQTLVPKQCLISMPGLPEYIQKTLPVLVLKDQKMIPIPNLKQGISWKLKLKNKLLPPINIVPNFLNMLGLL